MRGKLIVFEGTAGEEYARQYELPYELEEWDFGGMTLKVTRDTLIP